MIKRLIIIVVAVLALAYAFLAWVGVEPQDRRPGTRLSGELSPLPNNWAFTDAVQEVHLQTMPWFGMPFSVTVVMANIDGDLYVPSIYAEAAQFPGTKFWNTVVEANPNVHLRVGESIYAMQIQQVTSPAEFDRGFLALANKYPFWAQALTDPDKRPHFVLLRLDAP